MTRPRFAAAVLLASACVLAAPASAGDRRKLEGCVAQLGSATEELWKDLRDREALFLQSSGMSLYMPLSRQVPIDAKHLQRVQDHLWALRKEVSRRAARLKAIQACAKETLEATASLHDAPYRLQIQSLRTQAESISKDIKGIYAKGDAERAAPKGSLPCRSCSDETHLLGDAPSAFAKGLESQMESKKLDPEVFDAFHAHLAHGLSILICYPGMNLVKNNALSRFERSLDEFLKRRPEDAPSRPAMPSPPSFDNSKR